MRRIPALIFVLFMALLLQGCWLVRESSKELTGAYYKAGPAFSSRLVKIVLDNAFIEKYKDKVSMTITMTFDDSNKLPKPAFTDGDFHIAQDPLS